MIFLNVSHIKNLGTVGQEMFLERLKEEYQVLCIVNTKKRAQKLYRELQGEGVYHLSTSMCPRHRKAVLQKIRQCLEDEKNVLWLPRVWWRRE